MKKILFTISAIIMAVTVLVVGASQIPAAEMHKAYEYCPNGESSEGAITYFTISNVDKVPMEKGFIHGIDGETATAPVVITSRTELYDFGVSELMKAGELYLETYPLTAEGRTEPFDGTTPIAPGAKYIINDIGVYYVWARKSGIEMPVEATFEIKSIGSVFTNAKVLVNGVEIKFEAYNINGNNYFKLRDIAKALSGTEKQFDVKWNAEESSIELIPEAPYTPVGGELSAGDGTDKTAYAGNGSVYVYGGPSDIKAYLINNNNYFKLRDLGMLFDFGISWDGANNCITIDTTKPYTGE